MEDYARESREIVFEIINSATRKIKQFRQSSTVIWKHCDISIFHMIELQSNGMKWTQSSVQPLRFYTTTNSKWNLNTRLFSYSFFIASSVAEHLFVPCGFPKAPQKGQIKHSQLFRVKKLMSPSTTCPWVFLHKILYSFLYSHASACSHGSTSLSTSIENSN